MESWVVAVVAFASTNVDDLVLLAAWFADRGTRPAAVVAGQFLGIGALVALSLVGTTAAMLLPHDWLRWLGLLPVAVGVRALLARAQGEDTALAGGGVLAIAAVTFTNGGDNISVYVPLFTTSGWWQPVGDGVGVRGHDRLMVRLQLRPRAQSGVRAPPGGGRRAHRPVGAGADRAVHPLPDWHSVAGTTGRKGGAAP